DAIIHDGVDMQHPAFAGKAFHREARDFATNDRNPVPGSDDFHGTPVAAIAAGVQGEAMTGVAPGCTILPIRIGFGPFNQVQTLNEFRHASRHADILNCSFGFPPLQFSIFDRGFVEEIERMTRDGGRRGKGLVIVFSAGNDDAPTRLSAAENINGVRFLRMIGGVPTVSKIPAGREVFSAYPSIPGTVVVSSISSMLRKSGYSNWGAEVTVGAPSSNGHELRGLDRDFRANYRGLGQVAAVNRPGHGTASRPLRDDRSTPSIREDFYTDGFGGTSGAAPVVSGVVGLMLSVNPTLKASTIRTVLMATADRDLDTTTDLPSDPNLQGLSGDFVGGRSLFFGSGKVNAFRAVSRAISLPGGITPPSNNGTRQ
ncbi:MAG: S8 family serine peptidase, partial [Planctomycetota bacterium]